MGTSLLDYISKEAQSLIRGLLEINPERRLGYRRDAHEIKEHAFFNGID